MVQLDKEYKYYLQQKTELEKKYLGKFVVIRDNSVLGVYGSMNEAIIETQKKYQLGTFLVKEIGASEDSIMRFNSRVYVAG